MRKFFIIILALTYFVVNAQNGEYPFKPGIAVKITTYPDTTNYLNRIFIVNDNGEIDLPLVGSLKISNMNRLELEKILMDTYKKYIRISQIEITPLIRLSLLGGFENPGLYYLRPDLSLWDAISKSGGFLEEKGFKKMKIFRGEKELKLDLAKAYSEGRSLRELGIKSGDIVVVPIPGERRDLITRLSQVMSIFATSAALYFAYISTIINARRAR